MAKIIIYKNENEKGKYCQIKYPDGKIILISIAQPGIKIYKMTWFGLWPIKTIFEISTFDLFSDKYKMTRSRLNDYSLELDMLDVMKDIAMSCKSLVDLSNKLNGIFKS